MVVVVTVAVAVYMPTLIPNMSILNAMATAAVANVAGQATGNVLGVQHGFSFSSLATDVLSAGITEGVLGGTTKLDAAGGMSGKTALGKALGSGYTEIAARAMVSSGIRQGVGNLTGAQSGFSWTSVAAAGIGAAAGGAIGNAVGQSLGNSGVAWAGAAQRITQGVTSGVGSQLTRIAFEGGRLNWQAVASDALSATMFAFADNNRAVVDSQRAEMGIKPDSAQGLYQANSAYAAANADVASRLFGAPGAGGLAAYNAVAPDYPARGMLEIAASEGGLAASNAYSPEQMAVRGGGLIVRVEGVPQNGSVANAKSVGRVAAQASKVNGADAEILGLINQAQNCNSAITCIDTSKSLMNKAGIYSAAFAWAQKQGDFNAASTYLGMAALANSLSNQALHKYSVTPRYATPYEEYANPFASGRNSGEYSAGLSGPLPIDVRTQAQIDADQARIGKFALGTAMIATGVGVAGLPSLGWMGTGFVIGTGANTGVQYVTTDGFTTKPFNLADATYGGITGGLTMGVSFVPSVVINTGGAISTAAINNENATNNAAASVVGTVAGFKVGKLFEQSTISVLKVVNTPAWVPTSWSGLGLQNGFVPPSNAPQIFGATVGATGQEFVSDSVKNYLNGD